MTGALPRRTILVADDDAAIAAVVREALEDEGYRVVISPTHEQTLLALAAIRCALVLADTEASPVADDDPAHWRSVEEALAAARGTPVVIFSAHPPSAFTGYRERGFAGLVSKPFELDELLGTVRRLVPSA